MSSPIVSTAIISKANNPLFFKAFDRTQTLQQQYIVHASLDYVEEKLMSKPTGKIISPGFFIGLIHPIEEFFVYGFVASTSIKFILVLDRIIPRENDLIKCFLDLCVLYTDFISNPFYVLGSPITSSRFESYLDSIIQSSEEQLKKSALK